MPHPSALPRPRAPVLRALRLLSVLLALVVLVGCNGQTVKSHGTPVDSEALVTATVTVHSIEAAHVALGTFLIGRRQQACRPLDAPTRLTDPACVTATGWLRLSATEYTPKVLLALQQARAVLTTLASRPNETTQEQVDTAMTLLKIAFQGASDWGASLGWQPTLPVPVRSTP